MLLSSAKLAHRAALALNNEAVSLCNRRHFLAAKKVATQSAAMLQDLQLVLEEMDDQDDESEGQPSSSLNGYDRGLDKARQQAHLVDQVQDNAMEILPGVDLHVLDETNLSSLRSAIQYGPSSSVFFPVLLRDENTEKQVDRMILSRHLAVALYNQALACFLGYLEHISEHPRLLFSCRDDSISQSSTTSSMDSKHSKLARVARKSLNKATSILCSIAGNSGVLDFVLRIELMLISGVVYTLLSVVLRDEAIEDRKKSDAASIAVQGFIDYVDEEVLRQPSHASCLYVRDVHSPAA